MKHLRIDKVTIIYQMFIPDLLSKSMISKLQFAVFIVKFGREHPKIYDCYESQRA